MGLRGDERQRERTVVDCRLTVSVLRGGVRWLWWWWSLPSRGPSTQQTRLVGKAFAGAAPRPSRHYRSFDESTSSPPRGPPARAAAGLRRRRTYASGARAAAARSGRVQRGGPGRALATRADAADSLLRRGQRGRLVGCSVMCARALAHSGRPVRGGLRRTTLYSAYHLPPRSLRGESCRAAPLDLDRLVDVSQPTSSSLPACSTSPDAIGDDALSARVSPLRTEPSSSSLVPLPSPRRDRRGGIAAHHHSVRAHRRRRTCTFLASSPSSRIISLYQRSPSSLPPPRCE